MRTKKLKIGDITEIKTPVGLGYVQFTHDGKNMGELVRVLPGLYATRPTDFGQLAAQRELYFIFYTLRYSLRGGQTEIVSNQSVPQWAKPIPLMRHPGGTSLSDLKTDRWRIVDALSPLTIQFLQSNPVVRELSTEQKKLSIRQLWPHEIMVKEMARGWTPERAEVLDEQDRTEAEIRKSGREQQARDLPAPKMVRHFLYFPTRSSAEKAARWFRNQGQRFAVEVKLGADAKWLALIKHSPLTASDDLEKLRDEMEALTSELKGEYDGWEVAI